MKNHKITALMMFGLLAGTTIVSCTDDNIDIISTTGEDDYKYVGKQVEGFLPEEWYPGGELGTTMNTTASCYEDEAPAVPKSDLISAFKRGEMLFEHA